MTMKSDVIRRIPPPVWFLAAAGAQRLVSRRARRSRGSTAASALIAAGSVIVGLSAGAALRRHGTTITPEHPERATVLVTDGPFAFTRNPIYVAFAAVLVGHAVLRRSPFALLPAAVFVVVIDRAQIPAEERALHARFGRSFERYQWAVPRWIGTRRR